MDDNTKAAAQTSERPLCIWRLTDGKPGHQSQTLGLVEALQRLNPNAQIYDIPLQHERIGFWQWLLKRFTPGHRLPSPDLIIGAGHRTHWGLLAARRTFGGKAIALMSPTLPTFCFDTVVAPEHDGLTGGNVIQTRGVLNAMRPGEKKPGHTLVLVGGEGKHFGWDDEQVLSQIAEIVSASPSALITDSRRTPDLLRLTLASRYGDYYCPWDHCAPGWLASELAHAEVAWVSEDSVSMIYESLSAGCAVGLIGLQQLSGPTGRLAQGIQALLKTGLVTRFDDWVATQNQLALSEKPLQESERVAALLLLKRS